MRQGVSTVFGYPGGAILPAYDAMTQFPIRHMLVRHEQGATHMADGFARATGTGRRRGRDIGPRRDEHGHRHRHRHARLLAHRLHHGTGRQQADWQRRLSGDRHHGRHAAHHEAQLPGDARGRRRADDSRSVSRRGLRPSGSRAHRHHQGRAAELVRVRLGSRRAEVARLPSRPPSGNGGLREGGGADPRGEAAADSGRTRHHPVVARPAGARLRRAHAHADRDDAARPRRHRRPAIR